MHVHHCALVEVVALAGQALGKGPVAHAAQVALDEIALPGLASGANPFAQAIQAELEALSSENQILAQEIPEQGLALTDQADDVRRLRGTSPWTQEWQGRAALLGRAPHVDAKRRLF